MLAFSANTEAAIAHLGKLRSKANDLTTVFVNYSKHRRDRYAMQFIRAVDPYGKPWLPLSEATMRAKRKRGQPKLLVATGKLRNSQMRFPGRMSYQELIADHKASAIAQKRPLLPDKARGMPRSEILALSDLLNRHFED